MAQDPARTPKMDTRADFVRRVEEDYFGSVRREDLDGVLACFAPEATITVLHGDDPRQVFSTHPRGGQQPLWGYFDYVFANFTVDYRDFVHCVDVDNDRCACTFVVTLTPKQGSANGSAEPRALENSNFFECAGGLFKKVTIYYAGPQDADAGTP